MVIIGTQHSAVQNEVLQVPQLLMKGSTSSTIASNLQSYLDQKWQLQASSVHLAQGYRMLAFLPTHLGSSGFQVKSRLDSAAACTVLGKPSIRTLKHTGVLRRSSDTFREWPADREIEFKRFQVVCNALA